MSTTAFSAETHGATPSIPHPPEMAVLGHLLDQHPRRLTIQELVDEVGGGLGDTVVSRAVDNLAAASFLHREGPALVPAPAVVSFDQKPAST